MSNIDVSVTLGNSNTEGLSMDWEKLHSVLESKGDDLVIMPKLVVTGYEYNIGKKKTAQLHLTVRCVGFANTLLKAINGDKVKDVIVTEKPDGKSKKKQQEKPKAVQQQRYTSK